MATTEMLAPVPPFLKLLSNEVRWRLLEALSRSDRRGQELVGLLGRPQNLVSYHLRRLRQLALVSERRSAADGRDVYYSIDLARVRDLYLAAGEQLHPVLGEPERARQAKQRRPGAHPRVLFLCTHNSARSQMAEGILRSLGGGEVEVWSAGTEPSRVHPLAVSTMAEIGIDISRQRSKSMHDFLDQRFDYVVTVCDRASESCPVFPGDPERIHWSIPDPAAVEGDKRTRARAFKTAATELTTRIRYLLIAIQREAN
jgi:ArsR family transcriptional regulator, arsenate/arsenite/antimonite-responsive transcriptional repressor / arsenate reductase (thioredoxin)